MNVEDLTKCVRLKPLISVHHIANPTYHYRTAFDGDIPMDIYESYVRVSTVLKNSSQWAVNTHDEITQYVIYGAISMFSVVKKSIGVCGLRYTLVQLNTNRELASANSKEKLLLVVLAKIEKKEIPLRCKS